MQSLKKIHAWAQMQDPLWPVRIGFLSCLVSVEQEWRQ